MNFFYVHENNKMVRCTRFWKGKKWQFVVKQQWQQDGNGDDVAMNIDDFHFVLCNQHAFNASNSGVCIMLFSSFSSFSSSLVSFARKNIGFAFTIILEVTQTKLPSFLPL